MANFAMSERDLRELLKKPGFNLIENGRVRDLPCNARSPLRQSKDTRQGALSIERQESRANSWQVDLLPTLQNQVFSGIADFEPSEGMRWRMESQPATLFLPITPMGYLRQRKNDAFLLKKPEHALSDSQRKYVRSMRRYMAYRDELRGMWPGLEIPSAGLKLAFFLPMFKSWSPDRVREHYGMPHQRKPDTDNLVKAVLDALLDEDSRVWHMGEPAKYWGDAGWIEVSMVDIPSVPAMPLPDGLK